LETLHIYKYDYLAKQRNEAEAFKKAYKREKEVETREIIIPKLVFNKQEMKL
jgi:hypothetical protein